MSIFEDIYREFSTERFPIPDNAQVIELERRLAIDLPEDYREFILTYNGGYFNEPKIRPVGKGCPQDALDSLFGIGASAEESELGSIASLAILEDNDPPQIVPIGDTVMGGLIVLEIGRKEDRGIIYLKKAFGDFYHLADGIEEFFGLLGDPQAEVDD
jgi:hypothetical protein